MAIEAGKKNVVTEEQDDVAQKTYLHDVEMLNAFFVPL
jgi:hypothetical protein